MVANRIVGAVLMLAGLGEIGFLYDGQRGMLTGIIAAIVLMEARICVRNKISVTVEDRREEKPNDTAIGPH